MPDDFEKYREMLEEMYQKREEQKRIELHLDALWPHLKDKWDPENPIPFKTLMAMSVPGARK